MKSIRRSAWMVLILGTVLGCAGEEGTNPPANPPPAPPAGAPGPGMKPGPPPPPIAEPPKGAPSSEPKAGEGKKAEEPKKGEPPLEGPKTEGSKSDAAAAKLTEDELAAIKELPAAEQEQAIKQAVCPVSDEHLGSMGKPFKVTAEGRTFFLCCKDCEEKLRKDPKTYIAKLDKK